MKQYPPLYPLTNIWTAALRFLALAGVCALPGIVSAQGNYLSAPDGNPTKALVVDDSGNVGIGITNPAATLDVGGGARVAGSLIVGGDIQVTNRGRLVSFFRPTLGDEFAIMTPRPDGEGVAFQIVDGATYSWQTIRPWPNNGSPPSLGEPGYRWNYVFVRELRSGGGLFDGDVGIGINSPQERLDVAGNIRTSGKITCQVLEVTSDSNAKTKFAALNLPQVLTKIAALAISEWEYTNAPGVRHYGAMAQDFREKFGLGSDDKHINPLNAASVALAGVQALTRELQQRDDQLAKREVELGALKREMADLKQEMLAQQDVAIRVAALEKLLANASTMKEKGISSESSSALKAK